jgi:hypothetical protein
MRKANRCDVPRNYIWQQAIDRAERALDRAGFSMLSPGSWM